MHYRKDNSVDKFRFLPKSRLPWRISLAISICLLMGGLLTGCTSASPIPQAAPLSQEHPIEQATTGNVSANDTLEAAPRLGVFIDTSMMVSAIISQGPAERIGLQVGDILQSFDGLTYAKEGDKILDMLNRELASERKRHRLIVLRNDKAIEFEFDLTIPDNYVPPSPLPRPVPADSGLFLY